MSRKDVWTDETKALADTLRKQGLAPGAIGKQLGLDHKTVRRLFAKLDGKVKLERPSWDAREVSIIRKAAADGLDYLGAIERLSEAGFERTLGAVSTKASDLKIKFTRLTKLEPYSPKRQRRVVPAGWPRMWGTDEDRDALYVRLCLEGLAEIYRVAA